MACRNLEKIQVISKNLQKTTKNINIYPEYLNLQSFDSIVNFTKSIIDKKITVYALVNNAAIFYEKPSLTVDNIEITFQTNYLGPFLLTILLMPTLRNYNGPSRIINVSSEAHINIDVYPQPELHAIFDDTPLQRFNAYSYSKFCLVIFSNRLQQLHSNTSISVHCVDPGNCETNIYRNFPLLSNYWLYLLQKPIRFFIVKTPIEGAQSILHCILKSSTPSFYIKDLNEYTNINYKCFDPIFSDSLWLMSRKMCSQHLNIAN